MKILYAITKSEAGGAQTHVAQLVGYMIQQGHSVAVMAQPGGWLEKEVIKNGATFLPLFSIKNKLTSMWADMVAIRTIRRYVKEYAPDIIHTHSSKMGALVRIAIHGRIPTVFTAHGWAFTPGAPWIRRVIAVIVEWVFAYVTERIICVSEFDNVLAVRCGIGNMAKRIVIHNGTKVPESLSSHVVDQQVHIVFVGRLIQPKDPQLLVRACGELQKEGNTNFTLTIVGGGPQQKDVADVIAESDIKHKVSITGEIPKQQVEQILAQSSLFVLTSNYEGFPYTILEAMAYGLPVIASNVGGVAEAVQGCGILVPKQDGVALVRALKELLLSPEKRVELGTKGRETVLQKFTQEEMCRRTYEVYKNL